MHQSRRRLLDAVAAAFLCFPIAAAAVGAAAIGTSCESPTPRSHASDDMARCRPCAAEGDLACVDVDVAADTPRFAHDGVTYFSCSIECRKTFAQHPERYVPSERR